MKTKITLLTLFISLVHFSAFAYWVNVQKPWCTADCGLYKAAYGPHRVSGGEFSVPLMYSFSDPNEYDNCKWGGPTSCIANGVQFLTWCHPSVTAPCITDVDSSVHIDIPASTRPDSYDPVHFRSPEFGTMWDAKKTEFNAYMYNFMPNGVTFEVECDRWLADVDINGNFVPGTEHRETSVASIDGVTVSSTDGYSESYTQYNKNGVFMFSEAMNQAIRTSGSYSHQAWANTKGIFDMRLHVSSAFNPGTCNVTAVRYSYPNFNELPIDQQKPETCGNPNFNDFESFSWKITDDWGNCYRDGNSLIKTRTVVCQDDNTEEVVANSKCPAEIKPLESDKCAKIMPQPFIACSPTTNALVYLNSDGSDIKVEPAPNGKRAVYRGSWLGFVGSFANSGTLGGPAEWKMLNDMGFYLDDFQRGACAADKNSAACKNALSAHGISSPNSLGPCVFN